MAITVLKTRLQQQAKYSSKHSCENPLRGVGWVETGYEDSACASPVARRGNKAVGAVFCNTQIVVRIRVLKVSCLWKHIAQRVVGFRTYLPYQTPAMHAASVTTSVEPRRAFQISFIRAFVHPFVYSFTLQCLRILVQWVPVV